MTQFIDSLHSNMAVFDIVRLRAIPKLMTLNTDDFSVPTVKELGILGMLRKLNSAKKIRFNQYE